MNAQNFLDQYLDAEERFSKKIGKRNLRRLIRLTFRHWKPLWAGLLLVFVGTAASLLEPRLFGYAIDDAIIPKNWARLVQIGIVFLIVITARVVVSIAQSYLFEVLGQRVTSDLRTELFSHLQRLPSSLFNKHPTGRLMTRVTNDIASLNEMFSNGFVSVVGNILLVVGILVLLLVLDVKLGLIAMVVFPFMLATSIYFSGRLKISYRDARGKLSALNAFLAENLIGMRVVHLFNRQSINLERFDRINQWYTEAQIGTVRVFALFQPSITVFAGIAVALIIFYGGKSTLLGTIKPGILVAYFAYVQSMFQPMREIADKWNIFLSAMASAERVFSILEWPVELSSAEAKGPAVPAPSIRGHIVFENVWFAYDSDQWILKDFNLEIQPGMKVGIVGHTGAGKTTMISLLMRLYEPQKGRILLDGKDLREYDRRALRATFGVVQQDVFLFSGTFRDNITFWSPDPMRENEKGASLVSTLLGNMGLSRWWDNAGENGKPLHIEERGANLSVGEKQVLGFSRALYTDPKIWILDEATSNMDSVSEHELEGALDNAARGDTMIMIAHRLATVRAADAIVVLNKGLLVEKGNHSELLSQNGLYARLHRYQVAQAKQAESQKV